MQRINLRATVSIQMAVGAVARRRVGLAVALRPGIGTALRHRVGLVYRVVNRQVQRIDLRTAVGVLMTVGVDTGSRVGLAVAIRPRVAATSLRSVGLVHRVVDGQVQRINLRAAVGIRVAVGMVAGRRVGHAVGPRVGAASFHREGLVHRRVHNQHHRHHAVAAVAGRQLGILRAGAGEGLAVPDVRQLAVTNLAGLGNLEAVAHRQHHRH